MFARLCFLLLIGLALVSCSSGGGGGGTTSVEALYTADLRGVGSVESPYVITNIYQLQAISGFDHTGVPLSDSVFTNKRWLYGTDAADQLEKNYILERDIDASVTRNWNNNFRGSDITGNGWRPIGDCAGEDGGQGFCRKPLGTLGGFTGTLDGGGHSINSLFISLTKAESYDGVGLFSFLDDGARVTNLKLNAVISTDASNVGAIAGFSERAELVNIEVNAQISGSGNYVGGLVGRAVTSRISRSSTQGLVSGINYLGGLIGRGYSSSILLSYSYSTISGTRSAHHYIGGLAGAMSSSTIDSSFTIGRIFLREATNIRHVGGAIGSLLRNNVVRSSYSGTTFDINPLLPKDPSNVGLMFGSSSSVSDSVEGSYTYIQHSKLSRFSGKGFPASENQVRAVLSHHIGAPVKNDSTEMSNEQMRFCGLNGAKLIPNFALNCESSFFVEQNSGRMIWGPRIIGDNVLVDWVFTSSNHFPRLRAVDLKTGTSVFPSPWAQRCSQLGCSITQQEIRLSSSVYNFDIYNNSLAGDVIGSLKLVRDFPGVIYSMTSQLPSATANSTAFLTINSTTGEIGLAMNATDIITDQKVHTFKVVVFNPSRNVYDSATVVVRLYENIDRTDRDGDGIIDIYDSAPTQTGVLGDGSQRNPYIISNVYQLQAIAGIDHLGISLGISAMTSNKFIYGESKTEQLAAHYQLGNDIDAQNGAGAVRNFIPIGDCKISLCTSYSGDDSPFTGSFHGKGFVITNLLIDRNQEILASEKSMQPMGLFGYVDGSDTGIKAVGLDNASIRGSTIVGGLVGLMNRGTISQSYVVNSNIEVERHQLGRTTGRDIILTLLGRTPEKVDPFHYSAGAMVGVINSGIVKYSYSTTTQINATPLVMASGVTLLSAAFGGLTGTLGVEGILGSVYSINSIEAVGINLTIEAAPTSPVSPDYYMGGLAGTIRGDALIRGSYAVPQMNSTFGFSFGNNVNVDTHKYFTSANITALGGLVGRTIGQPHITDSYWSNTAANTNGEIRTIPLVAKQMLPESFILACDGPGCEVTAAAGEGDFPQGENLFPSSSWGGSLYLKDIQSAGWVFPAANYPFLSVVDGDGQRYLPDPIEQQCGLLDTAASGFASICNNANISRFPQTHYSFIIDLNDSNGVVGQTPSIPHPSAVDTSGEYVIIDSAEQPASPYPFGVSQKFNIDAEGNITYDPADPPDAGIYLLNVAAYFSSGSNYLFNTASLKIIVFNGDPLIISYTNLTGSGTEQDPYLISNVYQLQAIAGVDHLLNPLDRSPFTNNRWLFGRDGRDQLTKHYRLANNINASVTRRWNFDAGEFNGFTPIGSCPDPNGGAALFSCTSGFRHGPFTGSFAGAGNIIHSLFINGYSRDANGLFGGIRNAEIKDLNVYDTFVKTGFDYHNALLTGYSLNSIVRNSTVEGSLNSWDFSGGLAGYTKDSRIERSSVVGDFSGNSFIGALVGYLDTSSIIGGRSQGNVWGIIQRRDSSGNIGGMAGYSFNGNIIASVNNASILVYPDMADEREIQNVGGLIGTQNGGAIYASSNLMNIGFVAFQKELSGGEVDIVYGDRKNIGGLVGRMMEGNIGASYNIGNIEYLDSGISFSAIDYGSFLDSGGIVGRMEGGEVRSVWTNGDVVTNVNYTTPIGTLVGNLVGGEFLGGYASGDLNIINRTSSLTPVSTLLRLIGANDNNASFAGNRHDEPSGALVNCVPDMTDVTLSSSTVQDCSFNGTMWGDTDGGDRSLVFYNSTYWGDSSFNYRSGVGDIRVEYQWLFNGEGILPSLFARAPSTGQILVNGTVRP